MSSAMDMVKDILPVPDNPELVTDPEGGEKSNALADGASLSHSLATKKEHDEIGRAQEQHDELVQNLGWHEKDDNIPDFLVGGLPNEELWLLLRRFNKVPQSTNSYSQTVVDSFTIANIRRERTTWTSAREPGFELCRR